MRASSLLDSARNEHALPSPGERSSAGNRQVAFRSPTPRPRGEPATSISPVSRGGRDRDAQRVRGLFDGQADEETELDQIGLALVGGFEPVERVVQCEQIDVRLGNGRSMSRELDPFAGRRRLSQCACAAPGPRGSAASLRRPRRRSDRGCSTPAPLPPTDADQAEIRLMDESRRLQRLPRRLPRQLLGREPSQLVVDQRQELLRRLGIARVRWPRGCGSLRSSAPLLARSKLNLWNGYVLSEPLPDWSAGAHELGSGAISDGRLRAV